MAEKINKDFTDQGHGQDEPTRKRMTPEEEPEMRGAIFDMMKKQSGKEPEVQVIEIGDSVVCDWCGKDYTDPPESLKGGGLLFGSKACCPECAPRVKRSAKACGEESYIKGYCPDGMTFKNWVLELRGGKNQIKVYTF